MLKKLILGCALVGAAVCAEASTLYWQVAQGGYFTAATLYAKDASGTDTAIKTVAAEGANIADQTQGLTTGLVQTDVSNFGSGYSFFVEILSYSSASGYSVTSGDHTADNYKWNGTWTYDDLVSAGYIASGAIGTPDVAAGGGVNFGMTAPEPTSGMLLLLGSALLALRRRRS